jgi:hypothetical protein
MFRNLKFIHTRICYGFLNENNHQEYSILFVIVARLARIPVALELTHKILGPFLPISTSKMLIFFKNTLKKYLKKLKFHP